MGISLKLNVIARLEFELVFYDIAEQHVSHYTTGTYPNGFKYFYQILIII